MGLRDGAVVLGGARTPMGRLQGVLSSLSAADLGGFAIAGALERSGVPSTDVDYVVLGQVLQAGVGQNAARQAAIAGGLGMAIPALTINKVCLSDDPRGRVRHRRRWRYGVDVAGSPPADWFARG